MGVVSNRRRRRRLGGKLRVFMRMACRNFPLVVRMLWHLHGPIFHVHVLNLGAAHTISSALCRVWHERPCRLTVSCGKTSARARIRLSFTCLVCVSVTATRPCPSKTRHHFNRRPRGGRLRVFVRTDGLTPFICSYLTNVFGCSRACTHQRSSVHVESTRRARALLSPDGKLRTYFRQNANQTVLHLSGTCVCHHDTRVPTEDTTSSQPSPSLQPSSE